MERIALVIKAGVAAIGGGIVYWLGGLDKLLVALLALMVLDYASGLLSAWHSKTLSSRIGFRGIGKKVMLLTIVAVAYIIEGLTGGVFALREITITFFVVNEALSIVENATEMGLPVPEKIGQALVQLKGKEKDDE